MVFEGVVNASAGTFVDLAEKVGEVGTWIQAIGLVIILWLAFQIVQFILNLKKERKLKRMEASVERIEAKIDKLSKRK